MSSSSGPDIISNGLVLSLDASDKKSYPGSGITWVDRSGNSYNGTLSGGVTYNSSSAGSLVFDGVDDHVVWNTLSALKWQNWNSITIEAVFKLTSYTGGVNGRQYLFDFRDNGGVDGAIGCFHDTNIGQVGLKLFYNTVGNAYEEPLITSF